MKEKEKNTGTIRKPLPETKLCDHTCGCGLKLTARSQKALEENKRDHEAVCRSDIRLI